MKSHYYTIAKALNDSAQHDDIINVWNNHLLEVYLDIVQQFLRVNHQHTAQDFLHVYHVFLSILIDKK